MKTNQKPIRFLLAPLMAGALLIAFGPARAADSERHLTIRVSGILPERGGRLLVMLFRNNGFPTKHGSALKIKSVPVTGKTGTITLRLPARGQFAIKVLHDEDGDGRVTKKFGGIIPREGLGFSSGARLSWNGPPKFAAARFDAGSFSGTMGIELLYP